jgi:SAM-dependent methyltransferase
LGGAGEAWGKTLRKADGRLQILMKIFRGTSSGSEQGSSPQTGRGLTRKSSGLAEVAKLFASEKPLCILDLGATSPTNILYFTELGHKIYSDDLLMASADSSLASTGEDGQPALDSKTFLAGNLTYPNAHFDIIFCWNLPDYLDESLVKPVVDRLWSVLKPGGVLLAFFHTQEAGPDAPFYRYHMLGTDTLEMQQIGPRRDERRNPAGAVNATANPGFRLQRVFNNRHIENLFRDFASIKFFLTRDNIREVLAVR